MNARAIVRRAGAALAFVLVASLTGGCASKEDAKAEFEKECAIDSNQLGTLTGRWKQFTIPIAVREGQFSSDEIAQIAAAVKSWNRFFSKTQSRVALDFGPAGSPRTSTVDKPISACNSTLLEGGGSSAVVGDVVLYKYAKWPHTSVPDAIAITSFCKTQTSKMLIPGMYWAAIDLNFQNFFVDGKPMPDLNTNLLHEFGHLLGLDHSCVSGKGKGDFVSCEDEKVPAEYKSAIMFPFDQSADGVLKRKLQANDQQRMSCLYGDTAYPWTSTATPTPTSTATTVPDVMTGTNGSN